MIFHCMRQSVREEKKQRSKKKEKILKTATRLFLANGYSGTSTNDICAALKINKPTLYYFFKSKRQLFFVCHMRSIEGTLQPYLEKASLIEDPEERLRFMITVFTAMICRNPELRVLIHETMSINDSYFRIIRAAWKRHYLLLKETISELRRKGVVTSDLSSSRAAVFLLGMMTWITFWFDYSRRGEVDDVTNSALQFAFQGLGIEATRREKESNLP
jgi:AcrR family transcriptional regulator